MRVPPRPGAPADARLVELADRCVLCGVCLPQCPTYRLEATEAESPRGRIALARALATGAAAPTPATLAHLDHCLACLSCQKVCPSEVRYDELLARTRALLADVPRADEPAPFRQLLREPRRLTRLARIAAWLQLGRWAHVPAALLPPASPWRRLLESLPRLPRQPRFAPTREPAHDGRRVGLFRGCVASVWDGDTLAAARRLLEAAGHVVVEAPGTTCCGALQRHAGAAAGAARSASATRAAFEAAGVDVVLVTASGCHGDLRDHAFAASTVRVADVHAFLAADAAFAALRFRASTQRAALHLPCTQVNVAGATGAISALLGRVPGLEVAVLPEQPRCCGAAGSYFLEQPDFAERLRAQKLVQAAALRPDLLLTTNVGCRAHLDNGLRADAAAPRVLHPLALLAEQLENPAS